MTSKTVFYEFLVRGDASGNIAGSHYQQRTIYFNDDGSTAFEQVLAPVPVEQANAAALAGVAGSINTASLATIAQLQAQLAASTAPAPASNTSDALLASLNALFAAIPATDQAQFAYVYATVRVLVQAGQPSLAAAVVQGLTVTGDLAAIQTQILALLTPGTTTPVATPAPAETAPAATS